MIVMCIGDPLEERNKKFTKIMEDHRSFKIFIVEKIIKCKAWNTEVQCSEYHVPRHEVHPE